MRHVFRTLALTLLLILGFGPDPASVAAQTSSAQSSQAAAPWYADRLRALGFQVFKTPVPMPEFSVPSLSGGDPVPLSSLRGKVVLVNFWATWCPPCRSEMPSIETLWKETRGKPFTIMAISEGEKKATVAAFIAENGYSFPIYLDSTGRVGNQYAVDGIPTTFVVDKSGNAIARVVGGASYGSKEAIALFSELATRGEDKK